MAPLILFLRGEGRKKNSPSYLLKKKGVIGYLAQRSFVMMY